MRHSGKIDVVPGAHWQLDTIAHEAIKGKAKNEHDLLTRPRR